MMMTRWNKLNYHTMQQAYWRSSARFVVVPSGRRSGKTELAKRRIINAALKWSKTTDGRFVVAAPTRTQAKSIYWEDLKSLIPSDALLTPNKPRNSISESNLTITLWNNARLQVCGMDRPERVEGEPLDYIVLDEYANMKKEVWFNHVRPALSTINRLGRADIIGVPEGRNHYFDMAQEAQVTSLSSSWSDSWEYFHWLSEEILPAAEIAAAKAALDEVTYNQEYCGSFVNYAGVAYYNFKRDLHVKPHLVYKSDLPLHIAFDFNVEPGVAVLLQEVGGITCVIDEVHIPRNSNTVRVCNRIISDYANHKDQVLCYGDATGGARGSAKVLGSDWDLIKQSFKNVFLDIRYRVPNHNPRERVRVNSVNARCLAIDGTVRFAIHPKCRNTIRDFEGVTLLEGGSGEIDKAADSKLTHLTDALGYYIHYTHPIVGGKVKSEIL